MAGLTQLASWSDPQLRLALTVLDDIVYKAVGLGAMQKLASRELRLRETLSDEHIRIAKPADKTLVAEVSRGTPTALKINQAVDKWSRKFSNYVDKVSPDLTETTVFGQQAGKTVIYQRVFGAPQSVVIYQGPPYRERTPINERVEVSKATLEIGPSVTLEDVKAIEQITKGQAFWIGEYHSDILNKQIKQITREIMLEQGLGRREAAVKLGRTLGYVNGYKAVKPTVTIPKGWSGSTLQYFDGVAANVATVSRMHGSLTAMMELGVLEYISLNPIDERTCARCSAMNGETLKVEKSYQQITEIIGSGDPYAAREMAPWLSESEFMSKFNAGGAKALQASGNGMPPYHFKCRCSIDVNPKTFTKPVSIPAGTVLPPRATPVSPRPGVPFFNPRTLSGKMKEKLSRRDEREIREQLNLLGREEGGLVSRDQLLKKPQRDRIQIVDKLAGASGSHETQTGRIRIPRSEYKLARKFLRKASTGRTSVITTAEAEAMSTMIHESAHGSLPLMVGAYRGVGALVAELSAESAARHIMARRFGRSWDTFAGYKTQMNLFRDLIRKAWKESGSGAGEIDRKAAQDLMGRIGIAIGKREMKPEQFPRTPEKALALYLEVAREQATNMVLERKGIGSKKAEQFGKAFEQRLRIILKMLARETPVD